MEGNNQVHGQRPITWNDEEKRQEDNNNKEKKKNEDDNEDEDSFEDLLHHRESFWIDDLSGHIMFESTGTVWEPGRIFTERSIYDYFIPEASAMCVVTQIKGPSPGSKAILRIRKQ